ncbi:MAG: dTDP-4-dehydrorhamnose reductase [Parvularculaceae bacterium]
MRVLLFGPGGQIGAEIMRLAGGEAIPVPRGVCDLVQPGAARAMIERADCDVVVNAAGYTAVDKAESEREAAEAVNAAAPGEMAEACAARGLPFIQVSTDYVFDGEAARPYVETDRTAPLNVYGATKLDGERRVAAAGGASVVLRTSWVFSSHGTNFVKTMLRLGRERSSVRVVGDQRGKPTPAAGVAEASLTVARALQGDPSKAGLYHYAGDEATTWADFAAAIFARAKVSTAVERITTAEYPSAARRPLYSVLDTVKFERTFGLAAPSWRAGLDQVLDELARDEKDPRR